MFSGRKQSYVLLRLPNFGLANKFVLWAKALIIAQDRSIPLYVYHWNRLALHDLIRREKRTRFYSKYIRSKSLRAYGRALLSLFREKQLVEPDAEVDPDETGRVLVLRPAAGLVDFAILKKHRREIVREFDCLLAPSIRTTIAELDSPVLGVHIRRGDFVSAKLDVPLSYYSERIEQLRKLAGKQIPVTIFSDGTATELAEILRFPDVTLAQNANDLLDLMQLSKSEIIVPAFASTFSYWAAFLSENAAIIHHPRSWAKKIRPEEMIAFEGDLEDEQQQTMLRQILSARS